MNKNCLDKINSFGDKFKCFLLQGVTGFWKNNSLVRKLKEIIKIISKFLFTRKF